MGEATGKSGTLPYVGKREFPRPGDIARKLGISSEG